MKVNFVLWLLVLSLVTTPALSLAQAMTEEIQPTAEEVAPTAIAEESVNNTAVGDAISANETSIFTDPTMTETAGNAQCFDYYHFGSVVTDITPTVEETVDGATLSFVGTITNQNAYPLTGLDLYVKIFREQESDEDVLNNGHNLVDQFVAVDNVSLTANGAKDFSFDWLVPPGTIPGDYVIATYAMTNEAYNLSGLSFTDDVTGAQARFKVAGEDTGTFTFAKNKVKMNDKEFRFASMIPTFSKDETVTITVPYVNNTKTDKEVKVLWKQYNWDGLNEQALINVKKETFTVPAGKSKVVSYEAKEYKGTVTYVVADAVVGEVHSILDMRFARLGVEQARINFPSLTNFPLVANQLNTMFSCLHAVGPDNLAGATLDLTLTSKDGTVIAKNKYEGSVTSAMMGVKYDFTPTVNYDQVTLTAALSRNGVIEDTGTVTYDCQAIDESLCNTVSTSGAKGGGDNSGATTHNKKLVMFILVLGILALVGIFFSLKKRRHNIDLPPLPPLALLLAFLFGLTFFNFGTPSVLAKTVIWTSGSFDAYGYEGAPLCRAGKSSWCSLEPEIGPIAPGYTLPSWYQFGWVQTTSISNAVATVNYNTTADYDEGNVTVGDKITFSPKFTATDISFVGTGSYSDSPIGTWSDSANNYQNIGNTYNANFGQIDFLAALMVNKPTPTVSKTGGTGSASCSGLVCTVTAPGTLQFRVNYPATTGNMKMGFRKQFIGTGPNIWFGAGTTINTQLAVKGVQTGCPPLPRTEAEDKQCYNNAYTNRFILSVPTQNIYFNYTAVPANTPPNAPTITTLINAPTGSSSVFSFRATDPDGDALFYQIDWDRNGTVDTRTPSSGTVPSGTTQNGSRIWSVPGTYTFQARTYANGQASGWKTHSITISAAPSASVNLHFE